MFTPRLPLLVGGAAAVAALAYVALRDGASPESPAISQGSTEQYARAAISAPAGPTLSPAPEAPSSAPAAPSVAAVTGPVPAPVSAASPDPGEAYVAQDRDPAWARATEQQIRTRLAKLRVPLEAVECRHDQCELVLAGTTEAISDSLAQLETADGLNGFARSIRLTAPVQQGERMTLRAYAQFDRAAD